MSNTPSTLLVNGIPVNSTLYYAQPGQSIYDVCLMVYGSLDYLTLLCTDNNIGGLNEVDASGKVFKFDPLKVKSNSLKEYNNINGITYGTIYTFPDQAGSYELRDDFGYELRDDYSFELRT